MNRPMLGQFADLTATDFETSPVWIACSSVDDDEPWYDDTDEETFRPRLGPLPADPSEGMLLVDAVAAAGAELQRAGFELLHPARMEPWGQTVTRLLTADGLIVGISYAPALHDEAQDR